MNGNNIKILNVFDFDGTLIDTLNPEIGKIIWNKVTGEKYPHIGWWGKSESLNNDIFNFKPFPSVMNELSDKQSKPNSYSIILTSRLEKLRPEVQNILDINNIHVDNLDMCDNNKPKGEKILDYVKLLPNLNEINVYDDRQKEIDSYCSIRGEIPSAIKFNIYLANDGKISLLGQNNRIVDIINEEISKFK